MRSLLLAASCAAALISAQPAHAGCLTLIGTSEEISAYRKALVAAARPEEAEAIKTLVEGPMAIHLLYGQMADPNMRGAILYTLGVRCARK